jgi:hypothetical protein
MKQLAGSTAPHCSTVLLLHGTVLYERVCRPSSLASFVFLAVSHHPAGLSTTDIAHPLTHLPVQTPMPMPVCSPQSIYGYPRTDSVNLFDISTGTEEHMDMFSGRWRPLKCDCNGGMGFSSRTE